MNFSIELLAPIFAAVAAAATILAIFLPKLASDKFDQRMKDVKQMRASMRNGYETPGKKDDFSDSSLDVMRKTVEKFRMEEMLENEDLRMKLAQAGFRGKKAMTRFLFFRVIMPPLMAILAFMYQTLILAGGEFNFTRILLISVIIGAVGYFAPNLFLSNKRQKRQVDMIQAYPDALDLMVICVESGMSIEQSFNKIAEEIGEQSIALTEEISLTTAELSYLGDRKKAYENFANRTGLKQVRAITSSLIQAERYGTPVGVALRVISQESRDERMSNAEKKAGSLPAKLTVPMILFFLPVLFVVIIGPAMLQVFALD